MTIATLCRGDYKQTLSQFTILMRADVFWKGLKGGRYYGGTLTEFEVAYLTDGLKKDDSPSKI